jgi:hypothetical protein
MIRPTKTYRAALQATLLVSGLVGCSEQPSGMRGEFTLRGSTSDTLPLLAQRDPLCSHVVDSGSMVFHDDTLYSSSIHMTHTCKGYPVARDDLGVKKGKYQMSNDTLLFFNNRALTGYAVVLNPDTLTITGPGHVLIFARR